MPQQQVVIVGAGHGGFQLAASLRQHGFDGRIQLLTDEPVLPYQRPPLSKDYLDGKIGFDLLLMRPDSFYRDHNIDLMQGLRAEAIDRAGKTLLLASGERLPYDHLVLATGARTRVRPPHPPPACGRRAPAPGSPPSPAPSSMASASCATSPRRTICAPGSPP